MTMTYAITTPEGVTTYDLTEDQLKSSYFEGCRCWQSENNGVTYIEIFLS
jgi:hypothetical protein